MRDELGAPIPILGDLGPVGRAGSLSPEMGGVGAGFGASTGHPAPRGARAAACGFYPCLGEASPCCLPQFPRAHACPLLCSHRPALLTLIFWG